MRVLADYFPLLLFFVAFKWQGIWVATGVAIAASIVQIAWFHWRGSVSAIHWLSLAIIVVFGGATLVLRDETFIKWKPPVLYLSFAVILAAGKLVWRRGLLALVVKDNELPAVMWMRRTWSWVAFVVAMAATNWYVAFHYSAEACVDFEVWGGIGLF